MALLSLPPELVSQIFGDVGPAFFKQDIGRLTVSRQWYAVARRGGLFRDVTLRAATLRKLLALHESSPEVLASPLAQMQTLQLDVADYDEGVEVAAAAAARAQRAAAVNADLAALAPILIRQASRLASLCICASVRADGGAAMASYLTVPTVCALLQVPMRLRLDVLVLDVTSSLVAAEGSPAPGPSHTHICSVIGSLLPTLRKLHVRMADICHEVLVPPDADADADADSSENPKAKSKSKLKLKLKLQEVVVHTSLKTNSTPHSSAMQTSVHHARPCSRHRDMPLLRLRNRLYETAGLLAAQMEAPKTVRILHHALPTFQTVSMDVLAGTEMRLADSQAWEEDGKAVDNSDAETESSISSISDF